MASEAWHINPGHGFGFMSTDTLPTDTLPRRLRIANPYLALGASLQDILTTIEKDKARFTQIDIQFSHSNPLSAPIAVTLPPQGLRLRFDGTDQRLRLIEVVDLKKIAMVNKGIELVKPQEATSATAAPHFKRVYQMFGASYPGEYMPPRAGEGNGTYVLSWSGIAFNFPLQHSAYSPDKDHVSLLGSHAAGPASQMAIFEGRTWADARNDLFTREPSGPRSTAIASQTPDNLPAELELATIYSTGSMIFDRRAPAAPFTMTLNQTTPQDLITELGAPSTTYKPKSHETLSPPVNTAHHRTNSSSRPSRSRHPPSQPSSYSSTNTDTFETDFDPYSASDLAEDPLERDSRDTYWCYFQHGLDILVGPPDATANPLLAARSDLVVKRVVIQGNVPGSAAFNRHRRLRWTLILPNQDQKALTSESSFPEVLKPALLAAFPAAAADPQTSLGRVINRTWDDSMESSFYLPDQDRDTDGRSGEGAGEGGEEWLGNVRLFQFPGVLFEVLGCGAVGAVYCGN